MMMMRMMMMMMMMINANHTAANQRKCEEWKRFISAAHVIRWRVSCEPLDGRATMATSPPADLEASAAAAESAAATDSHDIDTLSRTTLRLDRWAKDV